MSMTGILTFRNMTRYLSNMGTRKVEQGPAGQNVATAVRKQREHLGMSLQELSEALGELGRPILPSGLSKIEAGTRRVDADDLVALSQALGLPIGFMVKERAPMDLDNIQTHWVEVARAVDAIRACEEKGIDPYELIDYMDFMDELEESLKLNAKVIKALGSKSRKAHRGEHQ